MLTFYLKRKFYLSFLTIVMCLYIVTAFNFLVYLQFMHVFCFVFFFLSILIEFSLHRGLQVNHN